ncbi:unnamed protein product [Nyctereutes procyonoides]|uniref:(raccoon dog) hypothetical protein n=1 Tax=Nyctereutes procyonoides TaxID=34880 RepID=A0A811YUR3_NYCPR|nr:unnamed protein product [Nyctereutes procyonoides]
MIATPSSPEELGSPNSWVVFLDILLVSVDFVSALLGCLRLVQAQPALGPLTARPGNADLRFLARRITVVPSSHLTGLVHHRQKQILTEIDSFAVSDVTFLPDPCALPERPKKRCLNEKEKLVCAPLSGLGEFIELFPIQIQNVRFLFKLFQLTFVFFAGPGICPPPLACSALREHLGSAEVRCSTAEPPRCPSKLDSLDNQIYYANGQQDLGAYPGPKRCWDLTPTPSLEGQDPQPGCLAALNMVKKKHQTRMLEFFIDVAQGCFNIGNFNSMMAIIGGMNLSPVARLKKTWSKVKMAKFEVLERHMDPCSNFRNYRTALQGATQRSQMAKSSPEKIVIPVFNLFVKDLYFLHKIHTNHLPNGHVNFKKFWEISRRIQEFMTWTQVECPFQKDKKIQNYLLTAPIYSEEALSIASFESEGPESRREKDSWKTLRYLTILNL